MAVPNLGPGYRQELSTGEIKQQETVNVKQLIFYLVFTWVIIVVIIVLFYILFFVKSVDRTVAEQYRQWSGETTSPSQWKTQTTGEIDTNMLTKLENQILDNEVFSQLKNIKVDIPLEPMGKTNPFVPYASAPSDRFVLPDNDTIIIEENDLPQID